MTDRDPRLDIANWLPDMIGPLEVQVNGTPYAAKRIIWNLIGALSVADDPDYVDPDSPDGTPTGRTNFTFTGGGGGEANTAANVGTGGGAVFRDKTGVTLNLKTIKAGANVTVTNNADDITIASAAPGETNTAANVGTGGGAVFRDKTGVNLELKTLKAGSNVTITDNLSDITIAASSSGGSPSVGTAGQVDVSDGAGGWTAPTNLFAGSSYFTVGVSGTPTTNGVRIATAYAYSIRLSGG